MSQQLCIVGNESGGLSFNGTVTVGSTSLFNPETNDTQHWIGYAGDSSHSNGGVPGNFGSISSNSFGPYLIKNFYETYFDNAGQAQFNIDLYENGTSMNVSAVVTALLDSLSGSSFFHTDLGGGYHAFQTGTISGTVATSGTVTAKIN